VSVFTLLQLLYIQSYLMNIQKSERAGNSDFFLAKKAETILNVALSGLLRHPFD